MNREAQAESYVTPTVPLSELETLYRAYVVTLENARDRIIALGGQCDLVDKMEHGDPALARVRKLVENARGK